MRYYTNTVPLKLVNKLAEAGFDWVTSKWGPTVPSYAEVFDWLLDKGVFILVGPRICGWAGIVMIAKCGGTLWEGEHFETLHEAANAAIEKALEILKKEK